MDFQRRKPISFSYFGLMMIKHTELFSNIRYDKGPVKIYAQNCLQAPAE